MSFTYVSILALVAICLTEWNHLDYFTSKPYKEHFCEIVLTLDQRLRRRRRLNKWAATRDFQQYGILTSEDSDEPVQPPFILRNTKWSSDNSLIFTGYSSHKQKLWSNCAYAQNGLRLCWLHIPLCWKSHAAGHKFTIYRSSDRAA